MREEVWREIRQHALQNLTWKERIVRTEVLSNGHYVYKAELAADQMLVTLGVQIDLDLGHPAPNKLSCSP